MLAYTNKLRDNEPDFLANRHIICMCVKWVRLMAGSSSLTLQESDSWLHSGAGWGCIPVVHWEVNAHRINQPAPHTHTLDDISDMEAWNHLMSWSSHEPSTATSVACGRVNCYHISFRCDVSMHFNDSLPHTSDQCLASRQVRVRNSPWLPSCRATMDATAWSYLW